METVKLTKGELFKLWGALVASSKVLKGCFTLSYAIARTKTKVEPEIKALQESLEASDKIKEYEKERLALCEEYSEKGEDGNGKVVNGEYKIQKEKLKEFRNKIDELSEKYKDTIADRKKQVEAFNDSMSEKISVKIHKLKLTPEVQEKLESVNLTAEMVEGLLVLFEE